jgi:hypothetical protein
MEYFTKPMSPDGIPSDQFDPEYVLKPLASRIPAGAVSRFYHHCVEKKIAEKGKALPPWTAMLRMDDADIRTDFQEMFGHPLDLFLKKLRAAKTPSGKPPKFLMLHIPFRSFLGREDGYQTFWKELCGKRKVELLDISRPYNALKTSFYPTNQNCCSKHYTAYGNGLIAYLLDRYLVGQKWVPFEPSDAGGKK